MIEESQNNYLKSYRHKNWENWHEILKKLDRNIEQRKKINQYKTESKPMECTTDIYWG